MMRSSRRWMAALAVGMVGEWLACGLSGTFRDGHGASTTLGRDRGSGD